VVRLKTLNPYIPFTPPAQLGADNFRGWLLVISQRHNVKGQRAQQPVGIGAWPLVAEHRFVYLWLRPNLLQPSGFVLSRLPQLLTANPTVPRYHDCQIITQRTSLPEKVMMSLVERIKRTESDNVHTY
jgi:hypothetical protein